MKHQKKTYDIAGLWASSLFTNPTKNPNSTIEKIKLIIAFKMVLKLQATHGLFRYHHSPVFPI